MNPFILLNLIGKAFAQIKVKDKVIVKIEIFNFYCVIEIIKRAILNINFFYFYNIFLMPTSFNLLVS